MGTTEPRWGVRRRAEGIGAKMSFAQRLDLRQSQQLVMTPQLQQAIKMLQMSNLELRDFIETELERNPLLERDERAPAGEEPRPAETPASSETPTALDRELREDRIGRADETFDCGRENLFADESRADRQTGEQSVAPGLDGPFGSAALEASAWASVGRGGSSRFEDEESSLEGRIASEKTLREHLLAQIGATSLAPAERLVAVDLIEQLDECAYLRVDLEDTANRLGADLETVEAALKAVQQLDPPGVAARTLKECLSLQLADLNRLDPAMATLLDHLDLLAARKIDKLMAICGVDLDDLRDMIQEIRALDPKPGLRFEHTTTQVVIPDVFVHENRFGGWSVELNTDTLPRLLINNSYSADVQRSGGGARAQEVKEYLAERQQSASWLLKSIDQRARTILKVASEIVRQQDGFLAYGVSGLRPLNLKRVADAIDMHESTVSRVTSNKFIATPRGLFELKYFFTPAIASTDGGEAFSAEAIRHRIKALIDSEPSDAVLSDDRIVSILRGGGVDIARRTVTKYREALGIPSSIQRRREKASLTVL